MYLDINLCRLRFKVKGLLASGRWARQKISKNHKEQRTEWWQVKRHLGKDTRHHLIAYGLLRNTPYKAIERHFRKNNGPDPEKIHQIISEHIIGVDRHFWTLEKVRSELGLNTEIRIDEAAQ